MGMVFHFENNMEHTYLVVKEKEFFEDENKIQDFRSNMLVYNCIPGLLRAEKKERFGQTAYCYDVSRLVSLQNLYERREIKEHEVRTFLDCCIRTVRNLEEYLLDENQIILDPSYIFMEPQTGKVQFVYYPDYESDFRKDFQKLSDFLLTKIDHTEKKAVLLGYELYRFTRKNNFVLGQIEELLNSIEHEEDEIMIVPKQEEDGIRKEEIQEFQDFFEQGEEEQQDDKRSEVRKKAGIIGSIVIAGSMFLAVLLSRLFHLNLFSRQQEMYFVAAGVMCSVASIMFLISVKKENREEMLFTLH